MTFSLTWEWLFPACFLVLALLWSGFALSDFGAGKTSLLPMWCLFLLSLGTCPDERVLIFFPVVSVFLPVYGRPNPQMTLLFRFCAVASPALPALIILPAVFQLYLGWKYLLSPEKKGDQWLLPAFLLPVFFAGDFPRLLQIPVLLLATISGWKMRKEAALLRMRDEFSREILNLFRGDFLRSWSPAHLIRRVYLVLNGIPGLGDLLIDYSEENETRASYFFPGAENLCAQFHRTLATGRYPREQLPAFLREKLRAQPGDIIQSDLIRTREIRIELVFSVRNDGLLTQKLAFASLVVREAGYQLQRFEAIRRLRAEKSALEEKVSGKTRRVRRQAAMLSLLARERSRLFASVTHDIKTPLSLITIPLDRLQHRLRADEISAADLEKIRIHVFRVVAMVQNFMHLIRSRARPETEHNADLREAVRQAAEIFSDAARTRGGEPSCELPAEPVIVGTSPQTAERMIANLLENALRYHRSREPVLIRVRCGASGVRLLVRDFSPVPLPAGLFQPFVHGEPSGNGIGLHLSRLAARKAGGDLTARKWKKKMTVFRLRLQIANSPPSHPPVPDTSLVLSSLIPRNSSTERVYLFRPGGNTVDPAFSHLPRVRKWRRLLTLPTGSIVTSGKAPERLMLSRLLRQRPDITWVSPVGKDAFSGVRMPNFLPLHPTQPPESSDLRRDLTHPFGSYLRKSASRLRRFSLPIQGLTISGEISWPGWKLLLPDGISLRPRLRDGEIQLEGFFSGNDGMPPALVFRKRVLFTVNLSETCPIIRSGSQSREMKTPGSILPPGIGDLPLVLVKTEN